MVKVVRGRTRLLRALGAFLGVGTLLLAGTAPATLAGHLPAAPASPPFGGSIAVRDNEVPDCLDPQRTALGASDFIFEEVVDTLVTVSPKGKLSPSLATRWKYSKDGKTITFFLRHGVKFSNGDPLTASDVKWTFDRALNPATKSPGTAGFLGPLTKTRVVNPYEVQLIFKTPDRPVMANLAVGYEGILDRKALAKEGSTKFCQYPVGSGPFKIGNVAPGFNTVTLVRNNLRTFNTTWSRNPGKAYLSQIVFKPIVSDATAISELIQGGLDISAVPGPQLSRVKGNPKIKLHPIAEQGEWWLGYNISHAPLNNVDVRRAIAQAIDRSAVIKAAVNGLGIPAYSPVPSTLPFYDKSAPTYAPQYNPTDAQRVLAANHVTGPLTLVTFTDPTFVAAAELIQGELAQVGVKVNIVQKSIADSIPVLQKGQFDLNIIGWGWPDPDILYQFMHSSQASGGGLNFLFYKSPQLDNYIIQGRENVQPKKARAAYVALQRFVDKNVLVDPLITQKDVYAARTRVHGWNWNRAESILYQDLFL